MNQPVAIFWDYENCRPPANMSGLFVAERLACMAQSYGQISIFKAYMDVKLECGSQSTKVDALHLALQLSGVSLTHCPHNGKKDVVDKVILVDMIAYAIDHPPPATIIVISGDGDFSYGISTLELKKYNMIVIAPNSHSSHLVNSSTDTLRWQELLANPMFNAGNAHGHVRQQQVDPSISFNYRHLWTSCTQKGASSYVRLLSYCRRAFGSTPANDVDANKPQLLKSFKLACRLAVLIFRLLQKKLVSRVWTAPTTEDLTLLPDAFPQAQRGSTNLDDLHQIPSMVRRGKMQLSLNEVANLTNDHRAADSAAGYGELETLFGKAQEKGIIAIEGSDVVNDPSSRWVKLTVSSETIEDNIMNMETISASQSLSVRSDAVLSSAPSSRFSIFTPLVSTIKEVRDATTKRALRNRVRETLVDKFPNAYEDAEVSCFKNYIKEARRLNIIVTGKEEERWIKLA